MYVSGTRGNHQIEGGPNLNHFRRRLRDHDRAWIDSDDLGALARIQGHDVEARGTRGSRGLAARGPLADDGHIAMEATWAKGAPHADAFEWRQGLGTVRDNRFNGLGRDLTHPAVGHAVDGRQAMRAVTRQTETAAGLWPEPSAKHRHQYAVSVAHGNRLAVDVHVEADSTAQPLAVVP